MEAPMARPPSIQPAELLSRMRRAFRENGYEGTSLSQLSASTGLANAALYHRYPGGKRQMAEAVLADLRDWSSAHVLAPLREEGEPRERLRAMCAALDELYTSGHEPCLIGLFAHGEALEHFGGSLHDSLSDLQAAIAAVVRQAGLPADVADERAEDAVVRIQGSLVVSRALRQTGPFARLLDRLPDQLLEPPGRQP
jgi:TetR/AcrR family transcriptional regulator, lmrAB and yxaGH operons repressor